MVIVGQMGWNFRGFGAHNAPLIAVVEVYAEIHSSVTLFQPKMQHDNMTVL